MSYLPDPKDPSETLAVAFDFTAKSNSVTSPTFTIALRWGTESPVTLATAGSPTVDGGLVTQKFSGGANLNDYDIKCVAQAADGEVLAVGWVLAVRSKPL